jgi:hypothetical protein
MPDYSVENEAGDLLGVFELDGDEEAWDVGSTISADEYSEIRIVAVRRGDPHVTLVVETDAAIHSG